MNRALQRGVTLMELLVSIMLLSLLSVAMLFAFRVGLNAMSSSNRRVVEDRRVLGVERALTQQIAGFMPVKAECRAAPDAPIQNLPFFQGEPQTMRFVSSYSLQEASRGYARILEFQVMPSINNEGVRLVVNERLYSGPLSTGAVCLGQFTDPSAGVTRTRFTPVDIGPNSFVLADKLDHCRFFYKQQIDPNAPPLWRSEWTSDATPLAVRIDMSPLAPDPSRMEVPGIIAPFRPDRNAMSNFVDYK